jgi:hypothetical protein
MHVAHSEYLIKAVLSLRHLETAHVRPDGKIVADIMRNIWAHIALVPFNRTDFP